MIFDPVKSYATYLLLALAAAGWATAGLQTYRVRGLKLEKAEAIVKAVEAARAKESEWSLLYKETSDVQAQTLRNIAAERDAALLGLRNRPRERLPQTPQSCLGASPAALSAEDSAVVIGWGAEFDTLRANYADCKAKIEGLTR